MIDEPPRNDLEDWPYFRAKGHLQLRQADTTRTNGIENKASRIAEGKRADLLFVSRATKSPTDVCKTKSVKARCINMKMSKVSDRRVAIRCLELDATRP